MTQKVCKIHKNQRFIGACLAVTLAICWPLKAENQDEKSNLVTARSSVENYNIMPVTFRSMDAFFHKETVAAGSGAPLPEAKASLDITVSIAGREMSLEEALVYTDTNALLVMKDGKIVYEQYLNGGTKESRFIGWSISKSVTSILLGAALEAGHIKSLEDTVGQYVPEARGTVYENVSLYDMLMQRAGTSYTEIPTGDKVTDVQKLATQSLFLGEKRFTDLSDVTITRAAEAGTTFNYSTLTSSFLGRVIEEATGMSLAAYTQKALWQPAGMQNHAYWLLDGKPGEGKAIGGASFNATARDFARIGQMMLNKGQINGKQVITKDWVKQSTVYTEKEAVIPEEDRGYQHQWWTFMKIPVYEAIGIHGQYISIDPSTNTVLVKMSYWPDRGGLQYEIDNLALFDAIRAHVSNKGQK